MTKDAVTDWDATAGNNTDIGGINIDEGCSPSGINNAARENMSQIATAMTNGTLSATGYVAKSSGYTAIATDRGKLIDCTADMTLSLTAATTLGAGWTCYVKANGGDVTIDPDGAETIDGATTFVVPNGATAAIVCDGITFRTVHTTNYPKVFQSSKSADYTVIATDRGKLIDCTADLTLSLTAAATLGAGFLFTVKANGGTVTIDPDGTEQIDGGDTKTILNGESALITCDGSGFHTAIQSGGVLKKMHVLTSETDYVRSSTSEGNVSDALQFTPVSANSRFVFIATFQLYVKDTAGGDNSQAILKLSFYDQANTAYTALNTTYHGLNNVSPNGSGDVNILSTFFNTTAEAGRECVAYGANGDEVYVRLRGSSAGSNGQVAIYATRIICLEYENND